MKRGVVLVLALLGASCGTRLSHGEIVRSASSGRAPTSSALTGAAAQLEATPSVTGAGATPALSGARGTTAGATAAGSTATSIGAGRAGQPAGVVSAAAAKGSPAIVATVGTLSGVGGATLLPNLQGTQLWVKSVNGGGGLNGHEVRLLIFDDNGDPARHRAQVQEAVEQHHVIAFLQNNEVLSGRGSIDYINAKRVPVIGADLAEQYYYESPMYFPQGSAGDAVYASALAGFAQQTIPSGKTKLGSIACAEVQACADGARVFGQVAAELGFDYVYRGKSSLTQPDFTAECLAARNAGAQVVAIVMDTNSISRIAASCSRQGYHPIYGITSSLVTDRQRDDPNLRGTVAASSTFPYFQSGTPATDEFQRARRTLGPSLPLGIGLSTGWVSGKLLEKAAANLSEPPTADAVLRGLWSLHDDTLGGITQPLTFVENRPPVPRRCWFNLAIRGGAWTSPDAYKLHCR